MLANHDRRLLLAFGLLLSCDREAASTSPDDSAPAARTDESSWEAAPSSSVESEAEPLDTTFRVEGGLSKDQVQSVIDQQFTPIRECFDGALERVDQVDTSGAIVLRWVVSTKGDVIDAEIDGSSFGDPQTERCIVDAVQRWSFPAPKAKPATIHYAFWLRSY
jgi:TonB family protein